MSTIMPSELDAVSWHETLRRGIDRRFDQLVQIRRTLHCQPELSGEERETTLFLYQLLGDEGFAVQMGPEGRGAIADMDQPDNGVPRIALRADIDALRIHDAKEVEYRSQRDGIMHACGHDVHTAIMFGAISVINNMRAAGQLPWPVPLRGIFQPSEETCCGAQEMIDVGALEGVRLILATHVDPSRDVGHIGVRDGVLTASCDEVSLKIVGCGGHAARPHEASDPIAAAAQLINALYLFIPRQTDSQDAVVVTVGQVIGGDNSNVIPEEVTLRGTIRTLDRRVRQQTIDHIHRLAHGIGETSETKISVEFGVGAPSVVNDPILSDLFRGAGRDVLGDDGVDEIPRSSMGSEDFAFYLQHVPGAMIRVGCRGADRGGSPLHSATFDVDEEAIRHGARIVAHAAISAARPE